MTIDTDFSGRLNAALPQYSSWRTSNSDWLHAVGADGIEVLFLRCHEDAQALGAARQTLLQKQIDGLLLAEQVLPLESEALLAYRPTDGGTLADCVRPGPIFWEESIWMTIEVGKIIQHLHREGFAHGRLSLSEILLTDGMHPLVAGAEVDCGHRHGKRNPDPFSTATQTGLQRSDVRALGTILHQMLVGDPESTRPITHQYDSALEVPGELADLIGAAVHDDAYNDVRSFLRQLRAPSLSGKRVIRISAPSPDEAKTILNKEKLVDRRRSLGPLDPEKMGVFSLAR